MGLLTAIVPANNSEATLERASAPRVPRTLVPASSRDR
jgi:hypothetical protein